jgi:hypothetical protein
MNTYQNKYKNINIKFGEIIEQSLKPSNDEKHANLETFFCDYKKWISIIESQNEKIIYEEANSEYKIMLLFLCMGLYKNAYMSLRGYFELTLFGVLISTSDLDFRLWRRGLKDVHWSEITDMEKGIFSKTFVETYNVLLLQDREKINILAKELYRNCSEYIHSGYKIINEECDICFNQEIYDSFCNQVNQINRIITYAFCVRYYDDLKKSENIEELYDSIVEQLTDIKNVHALLR